MKNVDQKWVVVWEAPRYIAPCYLVTPHTFYKKDKGTMHKVMLGKRKGFGTLLYRVFDEIFSSKEEAEEWLENKNK